MDKKTIPYVRKFLLLPLFLSGVCGCALFNNREEAERRREIMEQKKRNYDSLYQTIVSDSLKKGMTSQEVERLYGQPDDIFQSGTTTSHFEVWTYEKIMDPQESETWQNVRLYFENGRLISWQY